MLVLEDIRVAGQMRLERCLEARDVVGMDAVEPILGTTDRRVRREGRPSPAIVRRRRTPGFADSIATGRRLHLPQRAPAALRVCLSSRSACVRSVTSCQSSATPPATGRIFTCRMRASATGRQPDVVQRPGRPIRQGILERSRQFRSAQRRHGVNESMSQRSFAGTAQHAFEGIIPKRDLAVAVDHGHALFQKVDDLTTVVPLFEPVDVVDVQCGRRRTAILPPPAGSSTFGDRSPRRVRPRRWPRPGTSDNREEPSSATIG